MSNRDTRIEMAASNLVDWHESSVVAQGRPTLRTAQVWGHGGPVSQIYFRRIVLGPRASTDAQLAEILGGRSEWSGPGNHICDTWSSLDLEPHGCRCVVERTWAHRPAAPLPSTDHPAGLRIDRVTSPTDLADWEWRSAWGFGGARPAEGTVIDYHPAAILENPRMHVYAGRIDGVTVCGAMAYEGAVSIGMYAVYTLPEFRRRGLGAAMVAHVLETFPDLDVTTEPSESSGGVYERLSFETVGAYRIWHDDGEESA